jgi:CheY-like chemotaxis protein
MRTYFETDRQRDITLPQIIILAVGKDSVLLETRSRVLRSDGYTVICTLSLQQALALFIAGDFDLVVLCHSIPTRQRETLAHAFHDHSPSTPVVLVSAGPTFNDSCVDATIESEPKQLLQELPKYLHKHLGGSYLERKDPDHE